MCRQKCKGQCSFPSDLQPALSLHRAGITHTSFRLRVQKKRHQCVGWCSYKLLTFTTTTVNDVINLGDKLTGLVPFSLHSPSHNFHTRPWTSDTSPDENGFGGRGSAVLKLTLGSGHPGIQRQAELTELQNGRGVPSASSSGPTGTASGCPPCSSEPSGLLRGAEHTAPLTPPSQVVTRWRPLESSRVD